MIKLLYCEFLKLKRSKILLMLIPGALLAPFAVFMNLVNTYRYVIEFQLNYRDLDTHAFEAFPDVIRTVMLLSNPVVYAVITAYLFSREYSENTLKTILPVPTKRIGFILGKFIMLLTCFLLLAFISWTGMIAMAALRNALFDVTEFSLSDAFHHLWLMMSCSALMFLTITPFAFLAMWTKGYVVPVISSAAVVLANVTLLYSESSELLPWTAASMLILDGPSEFTHSLPLVVGIIAAVFILGVALSIIYFQLDDIK